jgi:hypothetical protein
MKIKILAEVGEYRELLVTALASLGHSCKVVKEIGKHPWEYKYYVIADSDKIKQDSCLHQLKEKP